MEECLMKKRCVVIITMCGLLAVFLGGLVFGAGQTAQSEAKALEEIVALELATYETWFGQSDPTAYAQQFADKATYFDTMLPELIEDTAIKDHLMSLAGKIPNLTYKILNPRVDLYGDVAVFVFNLEAYDPKDGTLVRLWKSSAVLIRTNDGWKKVHAHWTGVALGS